MKINKKKILFQEIVDELDNNLKSHKYGSIQESFIDEDSKKFILIFRDNPENWSVEWSIAKTLGFVRDIDLVFQIGCNGYIENSDGLILLNTIPDKDIRKETAFYFVRKYLLHPAEYANAIYDGRMIQLCGVECMKLYANALKLFRRQSKFLPHQIVRAKAIVDNIKEYGLHISLFESDGYLPSFAYTIGLLEVYVHSRSLL